MLWDTVRGSADPFESQNFIDKCEVAQAELSKVQKAIDQWKTVVDAKERDVQRLVDSSLLVEKMFVEQTQPIQ